MASSEHAIESHDGRMAGNQCKAAKECCIWASYMASWLQIAGPNRTLRRTTKPLCRKHAEKFASQYDLTLPEVVGR